MTKQQSLLRCEKSRIALRYWLLGRNFLACLRAMDEAERLHCGTRKDGVTPEFAHQIWIANYLRTLPLPGGDLELAIQAAFFHDTAEDKDVPVADIGLRYGAVVSDIVDRLTKEFRGVKVPEATYFRRIGESGLAALVKGVDRLHNLDSMVGVFTQAKQIAYIDETRRWHLPMVRAAARRFPEYEPCFENIKRSLYAKIELIELIHAAAGQQA